MLDSNKEIKKTGNDQYILEFYDLVQFFIEIESGKVNSFLEISELDLFRDKLIEVLQ